MKPQLKSSPAARALIQRFEPYRELAAQGSDGRWRVGFGHRTAAREGVRVSRDDASLLLLYDVMQAEAVVDEMFPERLPDSQRDALTSFVHDIGADAFRTSDVARYMFEGRVEAAAEALAAHGEGSSERREAEAAMMLADLAPARTAATRKPAMVDVVIKVEHATDGAEPAAPVRPALPDSLMPPPPPVMAEQTAARREAEREIARILATVGPVPQDTETPEPETGPEPETEVDAATEAAGDVVTDPVGETDAVAETASAATSEDDADAPADMTAAVAASPAEPGDEAETELEPVAETGPGIETETGPESEDGTGSETGTESENGPEAEAEPEAGPGLEAGADDAGTGASPEPAAAAIPASAQVIARMSREIARVQTAVVGRHESVRLTSVGTDALPGDISLGYVFTGAMSARFDPADLVEPEAPAESDEPVDERAETVEPLDEFDAQIEDVQAVVPEPDASGAVAVEPDEAEPEVEPETEVETEAETELEPESEAETEAEAEAEAAPDADIHAVAIVERTLAVSGDRTPPPHPGETPAPSEGAVGDIAGEGGDGVSVGDEIAHHDDLAGTDTSLAADAGDDESFSPHDLVGNTDMFVESKPAASSGEEDGWGFLATLIAGLVVTGAGVLDIYADWPRVWIERDPTWGVLAAVAGSFLVITAGWMLSSVLAAKRRRRAG